MKIEAFNDNNFDDLKIVNYFGVQIFIPKHANFVATDENYDVYAYIFKPTMDEKVGGWNSKNSDLKELGILIKFNNHSVNWKNSLVEFKPKLIVEGDYTPSSTKTIDYFGIKLQVPYFAKYIATNKDGTIIAYDNCPELDSEKWNISLIGFFCMPLGTCTFKNHDESWSQSLVEIE